MAAKGDHTHRFFKVLLSGFLNKLTIPRAFTKHIAGDIGGEATLMSALGRPWHVRIHRDGEEMYFGDGWRELVEAHELHVGYVLMFSYDGRMDFSFRVFDLSTCEKDYPPVANAIVKQEVIDYPLVANATAMEEVTDYPLVANVTATEEVTDYPPVANATATEEVTDYPPVANATTMEEVTDYPPVANATAMEEVTVSKESTKDDQKTKKVKKKRRPNLLPEELELELRRSRKRFSAKNPDRFEALIYRSNLTWKQLNVPVEFKISNELSETRDVILVDPDGRSWPVCYRLGRQDGIVNYRPVFGIGWREFAVNNYLRLGDKCIFELASKEKGVINVQIIRRVMQAST